MGPGNISVYHLFSTYYYIILYCVVLYYCIIAYSHPRQSENRFFYLHDLCAIIGDTSETEIVMCCH